MSSGATVMIHGSPWKYSDVQEEIVHARAVTWRKAKWQAHPALVGKVHGSSRPYSGQAFDPKDYDLVEGGWNHDHCGICWWTLRESDQEEEGTGYTDGRGNWLCIECHRQFISDKEPNQSPDRTPPSDVGQL